MDACRMVLSALFACAALPAAAIAGESDIIASNNQLGVQAMVTHVDYLERNAAGPLDSENGNVPGASVSLSTMWGDDHSYLQAQFSGVRGHTRYVGAPLTGGPFGSVVGTHGGALWDGSLRIGNGYSLGDSEMATLFIEVGAHEWDRNINEGETYRHKYYGVGLLGQWSPAHAVVFSANALVGRTAQAHISVGGPFGFSGDLGNSPLYRAGLGMDVALSMHLHAIASMDYTTFRYGMSNVVTVNTAGGAISVWEPGSRTRLVTGRIGIGFSF